jgi:hypothetical protein
MGCEGRKLTREIRLLLNFLSFILLIIQGAYLRWFGLSCIAMVLIIVVVKGS